MAARDAEAFGDAGAAVGGERGAIGFVVRGFENVGDAEVGGDGGEFAGHVGGVLLAFDDAGAGDEEEGSAGAEVNFAEREILGCVHA